MKIINPTQLTQRLKIMKKGIDSSHCLYSTGLSLRKPCECAKPNRTKNLAFWGWFKSPPIKRVIAWGLFMAVSLPHWQPATGGWCNNHLEKYEFVNGKDWLSHLFWKITKCLKPPSILVIHYNNIYYHCCSLQMAPKNTQQWSTMIVPLLPCWSY